MTESVLVIYIYIFCFLFLKKQNFVDLAGSEKVSLHDPINWKRGISSGHMSTSPK